MMVAYEMLTES